MDELEISGKRYISSRRAGKEHKYHPDYIGQLVRAGKVEGQKVGRAWYVQVDSLAEYLDKESPARESIPNQVQEKPVPVEKVPVIEQKAEPVLEKAVIVENTPEQIIEEEKNEIKNIPQKEEDPQLHRVPLNKVTETKKYSGLHYVPDNSPVFPPIQRIPMTTVPTRKIDTERVQIIEKRNYSSQKSTWGTIVLRAMVVVIIAGVCLSVTAFLSARMSATTIIEQGEAASTHYSF